MTKKKRTIITCIIILLLVLAFIPLVYVLAVSVNHMFFGFTFDFRGTTVYGISAFIKTLIYYVMVGWPVIILQLILLSVAVGLFIYLILKRKK